MNKKIFLLIPALLATSCSLGKSSYEGNIYYLVVGDTLYTFDVNKSVYENTDKTNPAAAVKYEKGKLYFWNVGYEPAMIGNKPYMRVCVKEELEVDDFNGQLIGNGGTHQNKYYINSDKFYADDSNSYYDAEYWTVKYAKSKGVNIVSLN